jgi:hypothetical protein
MLCPQVHGYTSSGTQWSVRDVLVSDHGQYTHIVDQLQYCLYNPVRDHPTKKKKKKKKEKKRKERGPAEQLHTQTLNYWAVLRYVSRNAAQPDHRVQGLINYCAQFRVTAERAAANALSQCVMTAG